MDFGDFTVKELKTELSKRNAVVTGRKKDLVERLKAYERNANFAGPLIQLPEAILPDWPKEGFRSLTEEHRPLLPKLSEGQIQGYLMYRTAVDKQIIADLKSLEKGKQLYQSDRVEACSIHATFNFLNFTCIVRAAMKKEISYNYKIRLNGRTAEIINSDCECPAGKGPHSTCKHIAAVLIMLQDFVSTGSLKVARTCTETLQTFHQPKKRHIGSPVKAKDMPSRYQPSSDPRPVKYQRMEGYESYVRSLVLNYCANTSKDITLKYLYQQADLKTATIDHDYEKLPFTEHWIDRSFMVSEIQIKEIEEATRGQANNSRWHNEREWRITASRFGDVCLATHRRDIDKLCHSIIGGCSISTDPILHGQQYEASAIQKFQDKMGLKVSKCGFFIYEKKPYLGATPDGMIGDDCIIEVKCPYTGRNEPEIKPGVLFPCLMFLPGGTIILKRHHKYYMQVQGQLLITCRTVCYFVMYIFNDLYIEMIPFDKNYCNYSLLPKLELFYQKHFRKYLAKNL